MEGDVRRRGIDSDDERMEIESNIVALCYMHGNVPAAVLLVIGVQCLLTDCVRSAIGLPRTSGCREYIEGKTGAELELAAA